MEMSYEKGEDLMYKKLLSLMACAVFAFGLTACSAPKEEGPDYADDEAMEVIASGYEKRADVIDAQGVPEDDADQKKDYIEAVEAELSVTGKLKDRTFEDSKLQEKVVAYINTLNDSLEVLDGYAISDFEFWEAWQKVYDERTALLKDFVDNYDLEVGKKYQDTFGELVANGKAAAERSQAKEAIDGLVSAASWEKVDEGYGSFTYVAVIENTSEYTFEDVSITLALYDAEGVKAEEGYASTQSWAPGEKVRFEAYSQTDAAQVKATAEYYSVAE